ncbi:MAG TPA: Crp/Fnr family transcriptional regulator [Caulobacteraceae bacterium]|nr:Crp/Fnr family transcriptional regulator [Caulobacteraceae bacterium]
MTASAAESVAAALGEGAVFRVLSDAVRARMAAAGSPLDLTPGAFLCQAGDAGDALYVVLEGEIEVLNRSEGGRQVRLASLGKGALAGEMAALDGGARSADMVAARRSRLWRIPRPAVLAALQDEPAAAVALVAELSRRLRAANATLEASALLDLGGRVARLALAEANARGVVALTQTEIARRLGASREKVNRKLHEWAGKGWVEITPSGVRLTATDSLAALVERARRR